MNRTVTSFAARILALACVLSLSPPLAHASRNVLFIAIDDMRVEPQAITPNIDALAAQSTRYTNAYASVPVCVGSRTTVMTGLKPSTHGVGLTVFNLNGYQELFADPNTPTLPEVMGDNGYYTATMGKVTHQQHPEKWDHAEPYPEIVDFFNPLDPGPDGTYLEATVLAPGETHPDEATADWAANFIQTYTDNQPFFLAVGFYHPHIPWRVPQWAWDLYPSPPTHTPVPGDLDDESNDAVETARRIRWNGVPQYDLVQNAGKAADYTRAYLAAISLTDDLVGQVLDALAASPHASNTDVVLWSDHGFHLGEKFHWRKGTFWETAVKVPLYIKSPSLPAGDVTDEVSLLDLAPTVLDLAGAPPEPKFEGVSLLSGRSPVEIYHGNGMATVSAGTKDIDYNLNVSGGADRGSYYLPNDPFEEVNLTPPPPGC